MARIKSVHAEKPVWLKSNEDDMKKIIAELASKHQPAEIGIILRDQYGIPTTKIYGKKLSHYLKELGVECSTIELQNVEKKVEKIKEHMKNNKHDKKAKHKLQGSQSRVQRINRYLNKK
jgi:small subunit ribosomal protein S15